MFKKGQRSDLDAECSHCPSASTSDEKLEEARAMVLKGRTITIAETAQKLNIIQGSVYSIVYASLGFHKDCARMVFRKLAEKHKDCPYNDHTSNTQLKF